MDCIVDFEGSENTPEMDWVVDFEGKLGEMETSKVAEDWKKQSIYKVYACTQGRNPKAYVPQAVAFGPYHHNEKQLKMQMDAHKHRALHHFLNKSRKPLKTYVTAMQSVVPELMACYNIPDANWKQDPYFLQLMLLDGCFMLEILRANKAINKPRVAYGDYDGDADPIFSYHGKVYVMPYIRRDMLMLENQLPMQLLEKLVTIEAIIQVRR
ncbi:putative transmembrane protein [Thalictrum thalictroides]|uniref:Putative transmembrane protein n=1 Tax=Thalictrum thalictroides TaxID=46969 RepID=A0A7J6VLU6_THATH|nr:putative transmembrane protein [Thalictrum thalictroides]